MFAGFANVWTIVGLGRDVAPGALVSLRVAGEQVLLFRDSEGRIAALIDRCPHRGVALSLGTLRDGIVECPFHGWRFDRQGQACHIPWNPDAKKANLGATALPVREAGGFLWLYTGFDPQDEPMPMEALLRDDVVLCGQSVTWQVHWTRAMENMLDSPHLPFVHRSTIGRFLAPYLDQRMDLNWTPRPFGAEINAQVSPDRPTSRLDYRFPNAMELFIDPPGKIMHLIAICLPEDEQTTRLSIYTVRNFARWWLLDPFFRWTNGKIAREDKAVLETSLPSEVPAASEEKSVRTDAPTLAFRKIYFERIKASRAAKPR
ncbi:MAG: aromatic ring-hydroxylating dioxygenase subunit alpha [Sphingobium sp.]|nr:aromatic ring-hydroxylating dioxygenase subunit alpha [Sphingobium sp.]